jgi:signal transduction histidine kinase
MPAGESENVPNDTYYDSARAILHSTLEALQAEYGAVSLTSAEDDSLQSYVSYGSPPSQAAGISVARWVVTHGQPLALKTQEEALLVPGLIISKSETLPLICVPIQVNGTTIGAVQSNFPSVAGQEELARKQHFLELAADLIGYIIENVTLRHKLQETKELLRNINNISLEIQERERERIILEVHDGIAQTLASALQHLQTIDSMGGFREEYIRQFFVRALGLIRQAIQETRGVINSITPATLHSHGLLTTLRQELRQFKRETGCQVNLRLATWPNLPRHMEFTIYRIIHEAVNNVRKHAKSSKLEVELSQEQKRLVIRVKDWGIGFIADEPESSSSNRYMGLFSMRRRAEFLGGTFKVNSSSGKGTEILVVIPWLTEEE